MALSILGVRQATCSPSTRVTATTRSGISAPRAEFPSHLSGFTFEGADFTVFLSVDGLDQLTIKGIAHYAWTADLLI